MNKIKKGSLISRLLSQKDKLKQKNKNLIKENKKLNNAFDELGRWVNQFNYNHSRQLYDNDGQEVFLLSTKELLDKLNELRNK